MRWTLRGLESAVQECDRRSKKGLGFGEPELHSGSSRAGERRSRGDAPAGRLAAELAGVLTRMPTVSLIRPV